MKPIRLQRSRQHKMVSPNGLDIVYVGRPSKWGNPFIVGKVIMGSNVKNSQDAVDYFRVWIDRERSPWGGVEELKGKNLACWCDLDQPCHGDVLLEIANN